MAMGKKQNSENKQRVAREREEEDRSTTQWTPTSDMLVLRLALELGFSSEGDIAAALRSHGVFASSEAIHFRLRDTRAKSFMLQAAASLQVSCPRWWEAMNMPADSSLALSPALSSIPPLGSESAESSGGVVVEPGPALTGVLHAELFEHDSTDVALPSTPITDMDSVIAFATTDIVQAGAGVVAAVDAARTRQAVLEKQGDRLISAIFSSADLGP